MGVVFQADKMGRILTNLLGRNVTSKVGTAPPNGYEVPITAIYGSDDGTVMAVCVCDLEFALNAGAALSMIPTYEVATNLKTKRLDPALFDNFKEILNVFTQLFGGTNAQHVKLTSVEPPETNLPDAIKSFISQSKGRRSVQVEIAGYGQGRASVFC